ncbi:MAG: hypothetical protein E7378_02905 [Clostridiales bacterium]|nr:hypothetical protein [Clostridiales bacterium]
MKYIITYNEQAKDLCFMELNKLNKNFDEIQALSNEQSLINIDLELNEFSDIIKNMPIIFLRHIFLVDKIFAKPLNQSEIINLIINNLNINNSYSIQYLSNINFENRAINIGEISEYLNNKNYILNVKNPEQIVSVYETELALMVGFGSSKTNLSRFKGGMPHFSKKQQFVSRAEYKLIEALDLCDINLENMSFACDLGAAPGGWTKVLASANIKTHAIDPASLSPEVLKNENVQHFRMTTEEYLRRFDHSNFDIIVNDMKMDCSLSSKIILDFYDRLNAGGVVVTTFKLAKNFSYKKVSEALAQLTSKYSLVLARQLFHNRSEITVVLKK